jgi:hypothetical protein
MKNRRLQIRLMLCCSAVTASAELKWDSTTSTLTVHPLQVEARSEFGFTNTGTNQVEILSLKSTCGCLKPSGSTNRVAPGEAGTVTVDFDLRDRSGSQRKGVAVRSSDAPAKPTILYVETNIPQVYVPDTKRLEWSLTGNLEPKICRLINRLREPVRLISVLSSSDQFTVELRTVREGFEYEVQVHPIESAVSGLAIITVQTECPAELPESRSYRIDACVR